MTPVSSIVETPKTELQQIIDSAPALPPLPPDAINFIEFRFRPKYAEFLEKLRKYAQ